MPVVPNGVACVASALDQAGYSVRVADLCFASDSQAAARAAARSFQPDVIVVSVRNIDNSDLIALAHYTPEAAAVLRTLRDAAPGARVIAGGAAFGVAPASLFDELGVDFAVAGDGERATTALLDALSGGRNPAGIPGVVYRDSPKTVVTPPGGDPDVDAFPSARMHRWLDLAKYERRGGTVPIQTKRGWVF